MIEKQGFRVKKIHFRYGHYAKTLRHWYKRYVENLPAHAPHDHADDRARLASST